MNLGLLAVFEYGLRHRSWSPMVLIVIVLTILGAIAASVRATEDESINDIEISLPDGTDPSFVPVGTSTEVWAFVHGTHGTNITNESRYCWEVYSQVVSWMPRAPNVIAIFPEWQGEVVISVSATWNEVTITTTIHLAVVRVVTDVILRIEPSAAPVFQGDQVHVDVRLLDWKGNEIDDGAQFCWSTDTGSLTYTHMADRVIWFIEDIGLQTVMVEYLYGQQRGSATYTVDAQRRLSRIEVAGVPELMGLNATVELDVRVVDLAGMDVTSMVDVTILLTEGNVSDIHWSWDGSGKLNLTPEVPGRAAFDIVADLNGSVVRASRAILVTGSLPDPEEEDPPQILDLVPLQTVLLFILAIAMTVGVVMVLRAHLKGQSDELLESYTRYLEENAQRDGREGPMSGRAAKLGIDPIGDSYRWTEDDADDIL